jgi:outer membrane protein OmpA-like peptidoglycan-associated protein
MPHHRRNVTIWLFCVALAAGSASLANSGTATAQSAQEQLESTIIIIEALKSRTPRGISSDSGRTSQDEEWIDRLREAPARSLTMTERHEMAIVAATRPSIDLEINFDFDSDQLGPDALPAAVVLGLALSVPAFTGSVFLIAGHTDAEGSIEYNQDLSESRALAVRRFLVETFGLPADHLLAAGYGKELLKNPDFPFAAENRRVEIVHLIDLPTSGND